MIPEQINQQVLSAYPHGFQTDAVTPLFPGTGLGRCRHWMVDAPEGVFCLRRWPKEEKRIERLQYAQAVLWQAVCEGIETVPLPMETEEHKGIVVADDSFWELMPWIDGADETSFDDSLPAPAEPFEIATAMMSLAQFHEATSDFPLPDLPRGISAGIKTRLASCRTWISRRLPMLQSMLQNVENLPQNDVECRFACAGLAFLGLIVPLAGKNMVLLSRAARLGVPIQPVVGNACRRHFRFDADGVRGIIDFKELTADNIALDIAMLLGSLAESDASAWNFGLKAYQSIRPLNDNERYLITAFDVSQQFLEGLEYLNAVFIDEKPFTALQLAEMNRRLDRFVDRLQKEVA